MKVARKLEKGKQFFDDFAKNANILEMQMLDLFIFCRFFCFPGPVLPGSMKTSNATRKAPELSGSISCRAFYLFTYLPGLPGHMKNEGQFCFSGVFLCGSCVSHLRKIRKFPHSSIFSFFVAFMYGDHCSCAHPKHFL